MIGRLKRLRRMIGWGDAVRWELRSRFRSTAPMRLRIPGALSLPQGMPGFVWARPGTSDLDVFRQVFVEREYGPLDGLCGVSTILDLGANVGYSSVYLLSCFPSARLVAVEPDSGNFEVLERNLRPFGDRATARLGGAWNSCTRLAVSETPYRDGEAWSRQVRAATEADVGSLPGWDVPTLMSSGGFRRVSLLKVDIEGAEAVVFDASSSAWLDHVDNIAIELHEDSSFGPASPVFWNAVGGQGFASCRSGELVLCCRPAGSSGGPGSAAPG